MLRTIETAVRCALAAPFVALFFTAIGVAIVMLHVSRFILEREPS